MASSDDATIESGLEPDPRAFRYRLRTRVPSNPLALKRSVQRIAQLARKSGCDEHRCADLEIAVREALANAIIHGNSSAADKRVLVTCYSDPDSGIWVIVRDQGPGFDPSAVPDPRGADRLDLPHGRGLLLMRELMDRVEFRHGGREVQMFMDFRH